MQKEAVMWLPVGAAAEQLIGPSRGEEHDDQVGMEGLRGRVIETGSWFMKWWQAVM